MRLGINYSLPRFLPTTSHRSDLINTAFTVIVASSALAAVGYLMLPFSDKLYALGGWLFGLIFVLSATFQAGEGVLGAVLVADRSSAKLAATATPPNLVRLGAPAAFAPLGAVGAFPARVIPDFIEGVMLFVVLARRGHRFRPTVSIEAVRGLGRFSFGMHMASIVGGLPQLLLPIIVLSRFGAQQSAYWSIAIAIGSLLYQLPSVVSQALLPEVAHRPAERRHLLFRSGAMVLALVLPALVVAYFAAPVGLALFGHAYVAQSLGPLRLLVIAGFITMLNYAFGTILLVAKKSFLTTVVNVVDAVIVLGMTAVWATGARDVAIAWLIGDAANTVLFALFAFMALREVGGRWEALGGEETGTAEAEAALAPVPGMTATGTTMPIMLTTGAAVEESLRALSERLTRRPVADRPPQRSAEPGEAAYCGIWFPPLAIPVGSRQVRTSRQLPVLTMMSAYSGWIAAILIPSLEAPDVQEGCWQALARLGGLPRTLIWVTDPVADEWEPFCEALGTAAGEPGQRARDCIGALHAYLERSFLTGQAVFSPGRFNEQLEEWAAIENDRPGPGQEVPPASLDPEDREAMAALPARFPGIRWRLPARVADRPYVRFDSNEYSVDPTALGKDVVITADLDRVEVLSAGEPVAVHPRAWSRAGTITDPAHMADRPATPPAP